MASRLGILSLPRQVLFRQDTRQHLLPANVLLPAHGGMLITRPLQEWACLLAQDLPFATAQRLLGWLTGEAQVLCTTEVRRLVSQHGEQLQEAEQARLEEALAEVLRPEGPTATLPWVPAAPPRRPAAWPPELHAAVTAALAAETPQPPEGVRACDWERVLAVRRQERASSEVETLARLGPQVAPDEVVAMVDEVLVRTPQRGRFGELRTARLATATGYRYLCGQGEALLKALLLWLVLAAGPTTSVSLIADGGRWIRVFFRQVQQVLAQSELRLDWYHLAKKCRDRVSRLGGSRAARKPLLKQLLQALWKGEVDAGIALLEAYRPFARPENPLDELQGYLAHHREAIPCYRERRRAGRYIGSGPGEKANDLLVARRQKRRGMHWNLKTSEALARLKCLQLNHEWDLYWQQRQLPRLVAA